MAWDATRPVPWWRLTKEWAVYATIMGAVFALVFRDVVSWGSLVGLVASYPLYLALGALLAKLGYQRSRLNRPAPRADTTSGPATPKGTASRDRPPSTRRTSTGPSQHPRRKRR